MQSKIILLAKGHRQYGALAYNLALTLKYKKCDIPVVLFAEKETVAGMTFSEIGVEVIDVQMRTEDIGLLKLRAISKANLMYEELIWIDVDSFATNTFNSEELLSSFRAGQTPVWYFTDGSGHKSEQRKIGHWINRNEVDEYLTNDHVSLNVQSSVVYSKRCARSEEFWTEAIRVHTTLMNESRKFSWYNSVPDELTLTLSGNRVGLHPDMMYHIVNFHYSGYPVHAPAKLLNQNHITTFPSAQGSLHQTAHETYNGQIAKAAAVLGINKYYRWLDKTKIKHVNVAQTDNGAYHAI